MTIESTDNTAELERALASLTERPQTNVAAAGLWRKALELSAPAAKPHTDPVWTRKIPGVWLAAASVVLMISLVGVMLPSMAKSRASSRAYSAAPDQSLANLKLDKDLGTDGFRGAGSVSPSSLGRGSPNSGGSDSDRWREGFGTLSGLVPGDPASSAPAARHVSDRSVIRKSTLDLTSTDVRGAFGKSGLVVNEALGEYIETSSLTGEDPTAYATMTLRVAATRLSEALNQLRTLGTVVTEATNGQDVTDTVVDLDARIRNEQRIEKELLTLIDKRPDSPLKELMEIRAQLGEVRGHIESLIGQRDRIGRMVSLATVLVTIRAADQPKPAPADEKAPGIGDYFKSSVAGAWETALHALVDTAAFLIRTVVGGIVWWALAAAAFIVAWRAYRRSLSRRTAEPVPVG